MPSNGDMDKLIFLAAEAKKEDAWRDFSQFCAYRGHGVRAVAFQKLDEFLQAATSWPFDKRLTFSRWLLGRKRQFYDVRVVIPHSLREQLIVPTVRQWCEVSADGAEPHLWLGLLRCDDPSQHLEQALKLDPSCEMARQTLTQWILRDVDYNQHELPSGYLNDPGEDLTSLHQASELTAGSKEGEWARQAQHEIADLRARAEAWIVSHPTNVIAFPGRPRAE
jgi:hypothetical protein